MAPINADVVVVEAQLSAIRVRRNGLAAQRALAGALSTALLAASLVVLAALRGSVASFAIATALAALVTLAGVAYAVWRTRQEWLSLPAIAHLADTHAALDERLTTLLAVAPKTPPPALRCLLVDQVVGTRQRWGLEALAPQRISRWLALVPLSLFVFAATAFYARPPAIADARHASAKPLKPPAQPLAGTTVVERAAQEEGLFTNGDDHVTVATAARNGAMNGAPHGDRDSAEGTNSPMAGEGSIASAAQGGMTSGDPAAAGKLDSLRQSIREAFGASPETDVRDRTADRNRRDDGGSGNGDRDTSNGDAPRPDGASSGAARAENGERTDTSAAAQSVTPGAGTNTADQGSRGSGRGGAGSAGSQGVLGAAGAPRLGGDKAAPMAIKLSAISGVSPSQREPQRRPEGLPAAATNASRSSGNLPDLADEQLADVTMQQLEVGPEHEAIIRRLFTRE